MVSTGRVVHFGLLSAGLLALAGASGCQPDNTATNTGNTTNTGGNAGDGGTAGGNTGGSTGGSSTGGSTGGSSTGGTSTGGSSTGGTGGSLPDPCVDGAIDATVYDVTNSQSPNAIGTDIKVKLDGVIAMSHKHLISHSSASGSCLWGVFVSAPMAEGGNQPLTETAPYSGAIVLSYGDPEPNPDLPCPTGTDAFANDVKPGDVLDVVGTTSKFILNSCGNFPADSDVPQIQIFQTCKAAKVGSTTPPAPHVLSDAEITALSKQKGSDGAETHNMWGGVKLRAEGVDSDPWAGQNGNPDTIVGPFGKVKLAPGPLEVPDGLYYVKGSAEVCETAPKFDDMYQPPFTWDHVEGFHYLAFCTWSLANEDKCADYAPQSPDCVAAGITTCYP
jgi:hypothetical protein